jgi:hypothetical protein
VTGPDAASWPASVQIDAWTGEGDASGRLSASVQSWSVGERPRRVLKLLRPEAPADPTNWRDPRVGWGLILAPGEGLSKEVLASGADAPEPIRRLLADREGPVFRCRPGSVYGDFLLTNYAAGKDVAISGSAIGQRPDALPRYLLIYGTPREVPWELQYILNIGHDVGRLDLEGEALENYVDSLLSDWQGASSRVDRAVIWAVDHGPADITRLMRDTVAARVYKALDDDPDLRGRVTFLDGSAAPVTCAQLIQSLAETRPALIVTSSHGQTGPLEQPAIMERKLGLPVDALRDALETDKLLADWQPDGAIWFAQACCSAGGDSLTIFDGLFEAGSTVDRVLKGVAGLGARVAPLPRALLGAKKPLRAFVGHVEPTFDWTLRQPGTNQHLTVGLCEALHDGLYQPWPVGHALRPWYAPVGELYAQYDAYRRRFNDDAPGDPARLALYARLAARDRQSLVLLGDPTVRLPRLPSGEDGL